MTRSRYPRRRAAEDKFPHRVDIRVPQFGLGGRLNEMHAWCAENLPAGQWEQHGRSKRKAGEVPVDYARLYFMNEADAAAFRQRWAG
jgi:hypothetical protein